MTQHHYEPVMRRRATLLAPPAVEALNRDGRFQALSAERQLQDAVNPYTIFFREPQILSVFKHLVLPSFRSLREISIASVGCSSGEEVYSLLLHAWRSASRLRIDGYDANPIQVAAAREGRYEWLTGYSALLETQLRTLHRALPRACLRIRPGARYGEEVVEIGPAVRAKARFAVWDIVERPLPQRYDAIVTANVLYHYRPEGRELILENIGASLNPGGWLLCEPRPWNDPDELRRQYGAWMADLSRLGFEKQETRLPDFMLKDQTFFSQVYRVKRG